MKKQIVFSLAMAMAVSLVNGCASVQRTTPIAPGLVNINLGKGDFDMLASVKGSSTSSSYLGGIVQVVDGSKVRLLWIKFFEDQYTFLVPEAVGFFTPVSVDDRAYYKALAATPDADAVIPKAFLKQSFGIPILYHEETSTFIGKALKYKSQ